MKSKKRFKTKQNSQVPLFQDFQIKAEDKEKTIPIINGLGNAIGFSDFGNQVGFGQQLSQVNTLFQNNRWYMLSNLRQLLSELYIEHNLIQTVIDIPVDDGLRGGVIIRSKQLAESQIQELQVSLDRDNDINTVGQAMKWNRLYGGAGVIVMTDQDPMSPLDLDAIGPDSPLEFRAVDMWELFWDKQNTEGYDPEIQEEQFDYYMYYAERLHKSRVMRMKGLTAPSFLRPRLRGWGFSELEGLVRSLNQYLKANDLGFEVLDEFKLDIYMIKDLTTTMMSSDGEEAVRRRIQMANWQKNYQNALVMDSEDDYAQKQLSFAGLAEVMEGIRKQIASDMRIPMTKLFGQSAAGFSSGEDDIEVYNSMVESRIRSKCKYDILRVIEIKCQKLFGMIPDDLAIEFKPLRVLGAKDEEDVKTQKFNRLLQAVDKGMVDGLKFQQACNRDALLPIQFDIGTDPTDLNLDDPEDEEETSEEPGKDPKKEVKDTDDGANREDTRTPELKTKDSSRIKNV